MRSVSKVVCRIVLAVAVLLIGTRASEAAPVLYRLTGEINPLLDFAGPVHEQSFEFTAPDFITSHTALTFGDLDSCVNCAPFGTAIEFWPAGTISTERDQISFTDGPNGAIYGFFFEPGAFSEPGTHNAGNIPVGAIGNIGTLEVIDLSPTPVPEPTTGFLILGGLIAMRMLRARKRQD